MSKNFLVQLFVDLGGSNIKGIVVMPDTNTSLRFSLPSRVVKLSSFDIANKPVGLLAKNDVWLTYNNQHYAVGQLALHYGNDVTLIAEFKEPKQDLAIPRLCAVMGLIQHTVNDLPEKFDVDLTLVLPYPEYQIAREKNNKFFKDLKKVFSSFFFREKKLQIKLNTFDIQPEGAGLLALRYLEEGVSWLDSKTLGVLMLGHRNTSVIVYKGGTGFGYTNHMGFHFLLQKVIDRSLGINAADLTKAIYAAGKGLSPDNPFLENLARSKGEIKKIEIQRLVTSITETKQNHWEQLTSWAVNLLPEVDELIIGGGTALLYKREIEQTWGEKTRLFWAIAKDEPPSPIKPEKPTPPGTTRKQLEDNYSRCTSPSEYKAASAALLTFEQHKAAYEEALSEYSKQLQEYEAYVAKESSLQGQLNRKAYQLIEEVKQTFFASDDDPDINFRVTQFVDIYGVWKATRHR